MIRGALLGALVAVACVAVPILFLVLCGLLADWCYRTFGDTGLPVFFALIFGTVGAIIGGLAGAKRYQEMDK